MKSILILIATMAMQKAVAGPTERYIGYSPIVEREFQISIDDCSKSYFSFGTAADKIWTCQVVYPETGKLMSVKSVENGNSFRIKLPNSSFSYLGKTLKSPEIVLTAMASGYQISFHQNQFTILGQTPNFSDFTTVRPFLEDAARQLPARITVVIQDEIQAGICK